MSVKRIQKLLSSEYRDFADTILIESPFAQTTREGKGIRQVQLGLTPTKFILATDILPPVEESMITYRPDGLDPEIETFELIAIYPVECVNLSVFRRRKRQVLKARFCNNRVFYFELGGFENRKNYWKLWCEKVKFLSPEYSGSSCSETSVAATSTSSSTLYIINKKEIKKKDNSKQIWCEFGTRKDDLVKNNRKTTWLDRHIYMGEKFKENPRDYCPIMSKPKLTQFLQQNRTHYELKNSPTILALNTESFEKIKKKNLQTLLEKTVQNWEVYKENNLNRRYHKRRYGLSPQPLFLNGLGPCNTEIQMKRITSAVNFHRQPELSVSKRQLLATISCCNIDNSGVMQFEKTEILFWTPDYWYRPISVRDDYLEALLCLNKMRNPQNQSLILFNNRLKSTKKKSKLGKFKKKNKKIENQHSSCIIQKFDDSKIVKKDSQIENLKRELYIDTILTAWDFDSTTLSQQLTIIDRDLFLKITTNELEIILRQRSTRNTPNISTSIAFAHRISNLVASDILKNTNDKRRARLITRFINVAHKCYELSNFNSCRIIIYGLQSPAIYRLKLTWNYVRRKHSSRYLMFEFLCGFFKNSSRFSYRKVTSKPFIPFIGDLIGRLLFDRVDIMGFLRKSQLCASRYSFNCDNRAMEYLLKARYKEERANFYHSLKLESSYY